MRCKCCDKYIGFIKEDMCEECMVVVYQTNDSMDKEDQVDHWYQFENLIHIPEDDCYDPDTM